LRVEAEAPERLDVLLARCRRRVGEVPADAVVGELADGVVAEEGRDLGAVAGAPGAVEAERGARGVHGPVGEGLEARDRAAVAEAGVVEAVEGAVSVGVEVARGEGAGEAGAGGEGDVGAEGGRGLVEVGVLAGAAALAGGVAAGPEADAAGGPARLGVGAAVAVVRAAHGR